MEGPATFSNYLW